MQGDQPFESRRTWTYLLASDLDGTLITIEPREGYAREVVRFAQALASAPGGLLAYITGRHMSLARDGIRAAGLPEPDVLVCDVGTSLFNRTGDRYVADGGYRRRMEAALGAPSAAALTQSLAAIGWLTPQEDEKQSRFKQSFYFPAERDADAVRGEIARRLDAARVACGLVVSHDPADGRGLVDVLPQGVSKATALAYLRDRTGLPPERVVFAGDSGNDTAALTSGCRGILVANSEPAVRDQVRREAGRRGVLARVHFAAADLAAGVIEGCRHFGIFGEEAASAG